MDKLDKFPNFFLVGAMKSGTTSLYHILSDHPDVFFPAIKEPHYFVSPGEKLLYNGPGDKEVANLIFIEDENKYFSLYRNQISRIKGDASAMYLYIESAAENIKNFSQNPYIIMVLRNPVDRAYSSYLHLMRDYRETLGFKEALEKEEARIEQGFNPIWHYKQAGLYSKQVKRYLNLFENVKVIIYDDFISDPSRIVDEVLDYLNLDKTISLDTQKRYNVSGVPKSKILHQVLRKPHPIKTALKNLVPSILRTRVKNAITNRNLMKADPIPEDCKEELYQYFKEDIIELEQLIGKDLSKWKN